MGLTIWDSEGLEKNVVDLQLREMSTFLEAKFEETFAEEMKVIRSPGVQDTHVHAVFLILDPALSTVTLPLLEQFPVLLMVENMVSIWDVSLAVLTRILTYRLCVRCRARRQ